MKSARRIIGRLGDVNFPEYDGGLVFKTPHGVFVEYVDMLDDAPEGTGMVGQFDVPGPEEWRKEWWAKDLPKIANTCGQDVKELERDLDSKDPLKRANVLYYCVKGYWSLCHNEEQMSAKELKRRYARNGPRKRRG